VLEQLHSHTPFRTVQVFTRTQYTPATDDAIMFLLISLPSDTPNRLYVWYS
jgi:hypothetical protein